MADISIKKYRGKRYIGDASPIVPAYIQGDAPPPNNPPGSTGALITPTIPETQIPFGDANGNLTSDHNFIFDNSGPTAILSIALDSIIFSRWFVNNRAYLNLSASGSIPIDSNHNDLKLVGNSTLDFTSIPFAALRIWVLVRQDAIGGHSLSYPADVEWANASGGAINLEPNSKTLLIFDREFSGTYSFIGRSDFIGVARESYTSTAINYTATITDKIIEATGVGITITLPTSVVSQSGSTYKIDNSSGGDIFVVGQGGELIQGLASQTVPNNNCMNIFSNGTSWRIS